ncbi:hypothetical protein ACFRCG_39660 [Embleya sp. NPDC056575]|uniref:hypothetical protein n=1 Tax=unclassified Embleya TaxID=2699296 RepID=UPI003683CA6A
MNSIPYIAEQFTALLDRDVDLADTDWAYNLEYVFGLNEFSTDVVCSIAPDDVAEVTHAWARQGDYAELNLAALMRLTDGSWAAVAAWCDTSGWDCQSGVDWAVGTREHVISQGLDLESRRHLGLTLPGESAAVPN